jgi:hypothetical protein
VFTDKGVLQQFAGQGWNQVGTGQTTIWLLQNAETGASRIVAMDNVTQAYSVNQAVTADLAFQKATETFVQWKGADGSVFGMTFDLQTPASQFADGLAKVVARLSGAPLPAPIPAPIASSSAGAVPAATETKHDRPVSGGRPVSGKDHKDKDKKDKDKKEKDKDKDKKDKRRSERPQKHGEASSSIPAPMGGGHASVPMPISETPEEAARRKRREACREIFTTEELYVKKIGQIVTVWKQPILKAKGIVTDAESAVLFSNIETILQVNTVLLHEIKVRIENWNDATTKIGDVFVKNAMHLKAYKQYLQTYNDGETILAGLAKKKSFTQFAKSAEAACNNATLPELLVMPCARVARYLLLLREALNHTPAEHPDHADLQEALTQLASVATELEQGRSDANFAKRLQAVISRNYMGLSPLLVPHRILHTEGELEVTVNGVVKGNVVLLFNDVIAFVIDTPKQKQVMSHIAFDTLWLMDLPNESAGALGFELQTPDVTYRCMAKEKSVRDRFYDDIEKQLLVDLTAKGALSPNDASIRKTSERVRKATYQWELGGSYEGEWVNAKMHGKGVRVSANGATFDGYFVKGFFHGQGTAVYISGDHYSGEWARDLPHGKGTLTVKTSLGEKRYVGDWESGRKKGQGVMTWENGDSYEGGWDNDHFHGRGTLIKKDGSRYEGDWNLGARHGHGTYVGPSGEKYEGSYEHNMKHGKGVYHAPDGSHYTGDFISDQRQGSGVFIIYEGLKYEGEFVANLFTGIGTLSETGGDTYSGGWRGGKRHGTGTLVRPNGERYEGSWNEDKRHGKGVWTNNHGTRYEGEYKDDKKHGHGTITRPDGSSYAGEWLADRREGKGTEKWPNGSSYDGHWKTDVRHGQGTYTWPDGSVYTGAWELGKRSGRGTLKTTAGTFDGSWKDDLRDGHGVWTSSDGSTYAGEWTADRRNGKGMLNGISEQIWKDGLIVKPGIHHFPPDLPAPFYFN